MIDLEAARRAIHRELNFLLEEGFAESPAGHSQDPLIGATMLIIYDHLNWGRRVEVQVSTGRGRFDPAISAAILDSNRRRIDVHFWLNLHHEFSAMPDLAGITDPAAVDLRIAEYCRYLKTLLLGPLKNILRGRTWEDVPTDWQGLR